MFLPLSLRIFLVVFGFFAVILDDLQRAHHIRDRQCESWLVKRRLLKRKPRERSQL